MDTILELLGEDASRRAYTPIAANLTPIMDKVFRAFADFNLFVAI